MLRRITSKVGLTLGVALTFVAGSPARAIELGYGGRVVDEAGAPLAGPVDMDIRFFDATTGGLQLGDTLSFKSVRVDDGIFQLTLSISDAQQSEIFGDGSRAVYVEVEAASRVYPRQRFLAVPMALRVPVDNQTLVFSPDSKLTINQVSMSQVTGLTAALAANANTKTASASESGYLSAADWTRFDAKQAAIDGTTTLDAGSLTTALQSAILVKPYGSNANETGELRFEERSGGNYVALKAPDAVAADLVWTLPGADGAPGQFLSTNGSGTLSWASPAGGGDLLSTANLSDLADAATARANLGLGALATASMVESAQITDGSIIGADISSTAVLTVQSLTASGTSAAPGAVVITPYSTTLPNSGGELHFKDQNGLHHFALKGPDVIASDVVLTLPNAAPSSSAVQVLGTPNLDGNLGWVSSLPPSGAAGGSLSGSYPSPTIAANAVTTTQIAADTITAADIAAGAVDTGELATDAVTTAKIADGTILDADIAGAAQVATSKLSGAVTSISGHGLGALATLSAVESSAIADGAIVDADISGTAAIATSKLSGAVTSISGHGLGTLATLSDVGSTEIMDGSVASTDIADGTIIDADIAGTAAISSTKISFSDDSVSGNAVDGGVISNFQSTGIDDDASSVAMTITSSGKVGIGTTNPGTKLAVHDSASADGSEVGIQLALPNVSGNHSAAVKLIDNTAGSAFRTSIVNNGTEHLSVSSNGNVGIGTTNPSAQLSIYQPTQNSTPSRLQLQTANSDAFVISEWGYLNGKSAAFFGQNIQWSNTGSVVQLNSTNSSWFSLMSTNSDAYYIGRMAPGSAADTQTYFMTLNSSGNVGIGTVSPSAKLQVNGQAASTSVSGSSLTIDFNGGNIQSTSAAAGTLVLSNMIDGASYTVVLTNAAGGNYVLSGSSVSTWHCTPTCSSDTINVIAGKHTVLSVFKIGTHGYASWINNL